MDYIIIGWTSNNENITVKYNGYNYYIDINGDVTLTATLEWGLPFVGNWNISGPYSDEECTTRYNQEMYGTGNLKIEEDMDAFLYHTSTGGPDGSWETQEGEDYQFIITLSDSGKILKAKIDAGAHTGILKKEGPTPGVYIYYSLVKN